MKPVGRFALVLLASMLPGPGLLAAQEQPLLAGEGGVPVPKKTKYVAPVYPPEARAQGLRGIVILNLVIDTTGHVGSATVVRSIPGLDEAAIAAVRQWEYEVSRVGGKPVSVRLTQAITFSLALPKLARDSGIPELRQGAAPAFPRDAQGRGVAVAEVTLEPDGRISAARILEGVEPWASALLQALQTWRFTPPPEDATLSFRVEAEFDPGRPPDARVALKASGLQREDLLASATPAAGAQPATTPPAAPPPAGAPAPPDSQPDAAGPPPAPPGGPTPTPASPQPTRPEGPAQLAGPPVPGTAPATPAGATPGVKPATAPSASTPPPGDRTAPPPVEVITAPPPQQPPENGVSAIRDVALEPGVPDLTRGRRPVSPPFARIAGAVGKVEVAFSVSAAGTTLVQSVSGPDLLKKAAEQAVASWVFRRTRADRAYLTAVFDYGEDKTTAVVRPLPAASGTPSAQAGPVAAAPATGPGAAPATSAGTPAATPSAAPHGPQTSAPATPQPATPQPPAPERPKPSPSS